MKKSTLITTIAMIVVVVVALSTATYAWFSASTQAVASTTITTTAAADWILTKGTITPLELTATPATSVTATFTSSASDNIPLANAMAAGLFAPSTVVSTAPSKAASSVISGIPVFYNATTTNGVTTEKGLYDNKTDSTAYMLPDIIKVANAKGEPKTLKLSVVVNVGTSTDSTATLYAGAATSFYVAWNTVGADTLQGYATNGYNYKTAIAVDADFEGDPTEWSESENKSHGTTARPNYATIAPNNFTYNADAVPALGIGAGEYTLTYDVTIGSVAKGGAVYVVIYTWIDGWLAEANAAGANYSVTYAFTTAA